MPESLEPESPASPTFSSHYSFPIGTRNYMCEQENKNTIDARITTAKAKLDEESGKDTDAEISGWFNDFESLLNGCRDFLFKVNSIHLTRINAETVQFLEKVQSFDFMATYNLLNETNHYLAKIKQFKFQLNSQSILTSEESDGFIKLLDSSVLLKQLPKTTLEKVQQIPRDKRAQLKAEENAVDGEINAFRNKLAAYFQKSDQTFNELQEFCLYIHKKPRITIQKTFEDLSLRIKALSGEIEKSNVVIDAFLKKMNAHIAKGTKIINGTTAEINKMAEKKSFGSFLKSKPKKK